MYALSNHVSSFSIFLRQSSLVLDEDLVASEIGDPISLRNEGRRLTVEPVSEGNGCLGRKWFLITCLVLADTSHGFCAQLGPCCVDALESSLTGTSTSSFGATRSVVQPTLSLTIILPDIDDLLKIPNPWCPRQLAS